MSMYPGTDKYREEKYTTLEKSLKTGDIMLFSGAEATSWGIRIGTFSPWSHIGMVIKTNRFSSDGRKKIYLWHSVKQEIGFTRDVITKTNKSGPQLNNLRKMIEHSSGSVYVRVLQNKDPEPLIDDPFIRGYLWFFENNAKKQYEQNYLELFDAQYDGPFGDNYPNSSSLFCSELVADTLRQWNYMKNPNIPSNEYVPADFSSGKSFHFCAPFGRNSFRLRTGKKWGIETRVIV